MSMNKYSFFVDKNQSNTVKINRPVPAGVSAAKFFIRTSNGRVGQELPGVVTIESGKVVLNFTKEQSNFFPNSYAIRSTQNTIFEGKADVRLEASENPASPSTGGTSALLYDSVDNEYVSSPLSLYVGPVDPTEIGIDAEDIDAWINTNPSDSGGGIPTMTHSGYWSTVPHLTRATSTVMVENRLSVAPLFISRPITITKFAIDVTTAGAGSSVDVALYRNHTTNFAPAQLIRSATLSGATVAVPETAAFEEVLEPGVYWLGGACRGATPCTVRHVTTGGQIVHLPSASAGGASVPQAVRTDSPTIPATFPTIDNSTALVGTYIPLVWFRVA